ncbi:hypothetical protein DQ04_13201000 [Trypanosoma grayi]|uniref:hypothetical protein n=1 Tax=Trypanosoma grayi TaxID=71804 RepID=UPI0004F47821|nr:hypothetical protein DQ04_13201000 [Trypanosoma grayi]KEG06590.1 hypothetical protein DQ04_13201000 [Trypanosoma grayi]
MYDTGDALLQAGGTVGACIPAEMWLLLAAANHQQHQQHQHPTTATVERLGAELARGALQAVTAHVATVESGVAEETSAENCAALLTALASMHYLATYFTLVGTATKEGGNEDEDALSLLGSASATRRGLQELLAKSVLTSEGLRHAFLRLRNSPSGVSAAAADEWNIATLDVSAFVEACWASLTHARVRLAAAAALVLPETHAEAPRGYAAAMAVSFEEKCMGLTNVTGRLLPDELCTMIEIVNLMHHQRQVVSADSQQQQQQQTYTREMYIAEIFVLHSIALTKHGLDAAPKMINSVLGLPDDVDLGNGATSPPPAEADAEFLSRVELGRSLRRAVEQTQWPWFLFPLYDDEVTSKLAWCVWMQRTLGVHQRMKHLLGWEVILCHALRWVVSHRESQRDWHSPNSSRGNTSKNTAHAEKAEMYSLLEKLYCGILPRAGGAITASTAAADTLRALTAYAAPHAEESMERRLFDALAVTATACEPATAVAIVRLLSHTIIEEENIQNGASSYVPTPMNSGGGAMTSSFGAEGLLRRWAATGRLSDEAPPQGAVLWDLDNFVELLQAVAGQHECTTLCSDGVETIILQQLVEGIAREYLQQHLPLTTFEREVLSRALEEVMWHPDSLHEALAETPL